MPYPNPPQQIRYRTGWRQSMQRFVPNWQSRRPGKENGWRWLFAMILPLDIEQENMLQSVNDWAPGSPNAAPDALPLTAQSRGILRGEAETDDHHAGRLQQWRPISRQKGRSDRLALEIQNYLANTPMVRVIERLWSAPGSTPQGRYITANPDGSISDLVANWDWDSKLGWTDDVRTWSGDDCRGFWSDVWIVVYPCEWGKGDSVTPLTGLQVPAAAHSAILRLVREWKGAHVFVRAIMFSYNAALFDPASPGHAGNPTGDWGNWGKDDGSGNQVVARNIVDVRYWIPATGGG